MLDGLDSVRRAGEAFAAVALPSFLLEPQLLSTTPSCSLEFGTGHAYHHQRSFGLPANDQAKGNDDPANPKFIVP